MWTCTTSEECKRVRVGAASSRLSGYRLRKARCSGQLGEGVTDNAVKGRFTWLF